GTRQRLIGQARYLAQHHAEQAHAAHRDLHVGLGDDRRAARRTVEDRHLAEVRTGTDPVELDARVVHESLAIENHEQRVAGLTLLDEVDARGQLGDLRVPRDRPALAMAALREEHHVLQVVGELSLRCHLALPRAPRDRSPYAARALHSCTKLRAKSTESGETCDAWRSWWSAAGGGSS